MSTKEHLGYKYSICHDEGQELLFPVPSAADQCADVGWTSDLFCHFYFPISYPPQCQGHKVVVSKAIMRGGCFGSTPI